MTEGNTTKRVSYLVLRPPHQLGLCPESSTVLENSSPLPLHQLTPIGKGLWGTCIPHPSTELRSQISPSMILRACFLKSQGEARSNPIPPQAGLGVGV